MSDLKFYTKAEADAHAEQSTSDWIAAHPDEAYLNVTMLWAVPKEEGDGTYTFPPCPFTDNSGIELVDA